MSTPSLAAVSHAQTALPTAQVVSQVATQPVTQAPLPLAPLHLPAAPGWWPVAWGWWAILALVIFSIFIAVFIYKRHKKRSLAKKTVLRLLKQSTHQQTSNKKVATVNDLLRQVCLSYYPRPMLASLHGERWYTFLDDQHPSNKANFQANQHDWQHALYQKDPISDDLANQLYQQVEEWITQTLPPSKKQLKAASVNFQAGNSSLHGDSVSSARVVKSSPHSLIEKEKDMATSKSKIKESKADV